MTENDIKAARFAEMLSYLEPNPALTDELDKWGSVYPSEKAHMVIWFRAQKTTGSGSYARSKPNDSAKSAYNRLLCPGAMLWIAETLGETPDRLREACKAAVEAENVNWRNRGKAFREVIPFERIYELFSHPENWLYDAQLRPYIRKDNAGYPVQVRKAAIRKILREEIY